MTKFILTEEEKKRILGLYEQPMNKFGETMNPAGMKQHPYFEVEAYVEDDAITPYYVSKFVTSGSNVKMYLANNTLYSINFSGPLYDARTNKPKYPRADFIYIDETNYKQLAKKYNIPLQ